jgi:hypothetical protein
MRCSRQPRQRSPQSGDGHRLWMCQLTAPELRPGSATDRLTAIQAITTCRDWSLRYHRRRWSSVATPDGACRAARHGMAYTEINDTS